MNKVWAAKPRYTPLYAKGQTVILKVPYAVGYATQGALAGTRTYRSEGVVVDVLCDGFRQAIYGLRFAGLNFTADFTESAIFGLAEPVPPRARETREEQELAEIMTEMALARS
jgi:hypothetical protein